jgi:hypothetical protein
VIIRKACVKRMETNPCVSTGAPDSVSTKKSLFHDSLGFALPCFPLQRQTLFVALKCPSLLKKLQVQVFKSND